MITKEELIKVNNINKELYIIDEILKVNNDNLLATLTIDISLKDINRFIFVSKELNEVICNVIKQSITESRTELLLEYNKIISPSEPNSLPQS